MGSLPRGGSNYKRVHERGDRHRPKVVGRIRSGLLQVLRPHQVVQLQEKPEDRAPLQQVRGTQGRLENFQNSKTKKLKTSYFFVCAHFPGKLFTANSKMKKFKTFYFCVRAYSGKLFLNHHVLCAETSWKKWTNFKRLYREMTKFLKISKKIFS